VRWIVLSVLLAVATQGCGSSGEPGNVQQGLGETAVGGFVVQVNPVFIVDALANAPQGSDPVEDADVRVRDRAGTVVAQGTTAPDGSFELVDLPRGLLVVEVRLDAAQPDPDVTMEFTSIPGVTVQLGRAYPVDRDAAIALALAGVPADALVAGALQPLPPGSFVTPFMLLPTVAEGESEEADPVPPPFLEIVSDTWVFFVDPGPGTMYAHPCEFVFVDAVTGAVERRAEGVHCFPALNGAPFWSGLDLLFDFADPANPVPTSEVVQEPPFPDLPESPRSLSAVLADHNTDPESIFVIILFGYLDHPGFEADLFGVRNLYGDAGVPTSNVAVILAEGESFETVESELRDAIMRFNAEIDKRFARGQHSTLIFHAGSHGNAVKSDEERPGGGRFRPPRGVISLNTTDRAEGFTGLHNDLIVASKATFNPPAWTLRKDGFYEQPGGVLGLFTNTIRVLGLDELGIADSQACRVRFFIDCCHSGKFVTDLHSVVFGSTSHHFVGYGGSFDLGDINDSGAKFTRTALPLMRVENGDVTGLIDASGTQLVPAIRAIEVDQTPILRIHDRDPCPPPAPDLISLNGDSFPVMHVVGVSPCPQFIAEVQVTNETQDALGLEAVESHDALFLSPTSTTIPPKGMASVVIFFDCSPPESLMEMIIFRATSFATSEQEEEVATVDVTVSSG
jgi:hypothetical protein